MLTTTASHETITPLKCIISIGYDSIEQTKDKGLKQQIGLIVSTAKRLLYQFKDLLDRGIEEKGRLELVY